MTAIRIRRKKAWMDRLSAYRVMIDDEQVGTVKDGEEKLVEVAAGRHRLRFKLQWVSSASTEVVLSVGETVNVVCGPRGHPLTALYWISAGKNRYIETVVSPPSQQ